MVASTFFQAALAANQAPLELRPLQTAIERQIRMRDFLLINQSQTVVAVRPFMAGAISQGIRAEISYFQRLLELGLQETATDDVGFLIHTAADEAARRRGALSKFLSFYDNGARPEENERVYTALYEGIVATVSAGTGVSDIPAHDLGELVDKATRETQPGLKSALLGQRSPTGTTSRSPFRASELDKSQIRRAKMLMGERVFQIWNGEPFAEDQDRVFDRSARFRNWYVVPEQYASDPGAAVDQIARRLRLRL